MNKTYTSMKLDDIKKYLNSYHYSESYDSSKEYKTDLYINDYGKGSHQYRNKLITIKVEDKNYEKKYVVADEELREDEQTVLFEYCQCYVCNKAWYDITKYFSCPCCVGCVGSPFPKQYVIDKTREYMKINVPKCL